MKSSASSQAGDAPSSIAVDFGAGRREPPGSDQTGDLHCSIATDFGAGWREPPGSDQKVASPSSIATDFGAGRRKPPGSDQTRDSHSSIATDFGAGWREPPGSDQKVDSHSSVATDFGAGRRKPPGSDQTGDSHSSVAADSPWKHGLEWPAVIWIGSLHLGALAAPFYFTWSGLLLAVCLSWVTGCLGVCLGFHRLLTHASFETYRPLRRMFALFGTLAGEGPPIMWVSAHRKHHRFSDQEQDPHSPRDGGWWSHMTWMFPRYGSQHWAQLYRQYAPDLLKDRFLRMLDRTFLWWQLAFGASMFCAGWLIWDVRTGISLVVWGMFVRLLYVLHITWAVNSASHKWGYRTYETHDDSRNLWWIGLLGWGEGWHNNHHAFQRVASHGHRWWEMDVTYTVVALMERTGLAWNVVRLPVSVAKPAVAVLVNDNAATIDFQLPLPRVDVAIAAASQ